MANEAPKESRFLIYNSPAGDVNVNVFFADDTVWLTQERMAELFQTTKQNIGQHLKNIFEDGELSEESVVKIFFTTAADGKQYRTNHYNLDAIISVGYRVKSTVATRFRIWATNLLREFMVKGFVLDDDRLKQGERLSGNDYFRELLERVRSIRASERRIYLQITDIFAECSTDYDPNAAITQEFFAMVQNKFHYAITGKTAAELISERADRTKRNMGLETFKHAPDGRILQSDVLIAKNYLPEDQIKRLERTVSGFFDYIENLIENRQTFTMAEFAESVNKFLAFNEYRILDGKGRISKKQAEKKALREYQAFNKTQPIKSDFEKMVKRVATRAKKRDQ